MIIKNRQGCIYSMRINYTLFFIYPDPLINLVDNLSNKNCIKLSLTQLLLQDEIIDFNYYKNFKK